MSDDKEDEDDSEEGSAVAWTLARGQPLLIAIVRKTFPALPTSMARSNCIFSGEDDDDEGRLLKYAGLILDDNEAPLLPPLLLLLLKLDDDEDDATAADDDDDELELVLMTAPSVVSTCEDDTSST